METLIVDYNQTANAYGNCRCVELPIKSYPFYDDGRWIDREYSILPQESVPDSVEHDWVAVVKHRGVYCVMASFCPDNFVGHNFIVSETGCNIDRTMATPRYYDIDVCDALVEALFSFVTSDVDLYVQDDFCEKILCKFFIASGLGLIRSMNFTRIAKLRDGDMLVRGGSPVYLAAIEGPIMEDLEKHGYFGAEEPLFDFTKQDTIYILYVNENKVYHASFTSVSDGIEWGGITFSVTEAKLLKSILDSFDFTVMTSSVSDVDALVKYESIVSSDDIIQTYLLKKKIPMDCIPETKEELLKLFYKENEEQLKIVVADLAGGIK